MNKRLKILVVLFGVLYVAIVIFNFTANFGDISGSFMDGFNSVYKDKDNVEIKRSYEIVWFDVLPKDERYIDNLENLKTGKTLKARTNTFAVKLDPEEITAEKLLVDTLYSLTVLVMLFALIFIPILVFVIIRSIVKNDVFNVLNIKRLKWIGYALIGIFAASLFHYLHDFIIARNLLELQNYKVVFTMGESYLYLIMGIATLLFAEILKIFDGDKRGE